MVLDPETLGSLLRHLQEFEALYETEGTDSLPGPGGDLFCLADLLRLYRMRSRLIPEHALGIEALYLDMSDADAARHIGLAGPKLVAASTREGLQHLCAMFDDGLWKDDRHDGRSWGHTGPGSEAAAPERSLQGA